ncbi:MAG TPA: hypothetical protein VFN89_06690 [Solirubrobacterales bacterium]|nr:hypothetical protein [Solirubrobacterales bacterium]
MLAATLTALALAGPAAAAPAPIESFDGSGSPAGSMSPTWLSVDEANGDVYVIDSANDAVDIFAENPGVDPAHPLGYEYVGQLLGSSTTAGSFSFGGVDDIAVDNSSNPATQGDVYVNSESAGKIFAFDPSQPPAERFLWESPGVESPDVCGVAVDAAGNPWLSDFNQGPQKLDPVTGSFVERPFGAFAYCHMAFDSSGNFLLNLYQGDIWKFSSEGTPQSTYRPSGHRRDVAVDITTNDVYAAPEGEPIRKWTATGLASESETFGSESVGVTVDAAHERLFATNGSEVTVYTTFEPVLAIQKTGPGNGRVRCEFQSSLGPCAGAYSLNGEVTLSADPAPHSFFSGWTVDGDASTCSGTGSCTLTLEADTTVEADFGVFEHTFSVATEGPGSGSVEIEPFAIECEALCSGEYAEGEYIALHAIAKPHSEFSNWSGACSGASTYCEIESLEADTEVTASFGPAHQPLVISTSGTGAVSCDTGTGPEACAPSYLDGTEVALSANPSAASTFTGWSGACAGTGSCQLTMDGPKNRFQKEGPAA